jgi:hypothetical protein
VRRAPQSCRVGARPKNLKSPKTPVIPESYIWYIVQDKTSEFDHESHGMADVWVGILIQERLFPGSKSEGLYWVLLCDDGLWYRIADIHHFFAVDKLESMRGKRISLNAKLDLLRGHRRLVVQSEQLNEESMSPPPSESQASDGGT